LFEKGSGKTESLNKPQVEKGVKGGRETYLKKRKKLRGGKFKKIKITRRGSGKM